MFRRAELERLAELTARPASSSPTRSTATWCSTPGKPHVPIASLAPEVSRRTVTLMSPNKAFNFPGRGLRLGDHRGSRRCAARSPRTSTRTCCTRPRCSATWPRWPRYRDGDAWLAAQLEYLRGNRDLVEQAASACRWRTSRRPTSPGSTAPALRRMPLRAIPRSTAWRCRRARSSATRGSCG